MSHLCEPSMLNNYTGFLEVALFCYGFWTFSRGPFPLFVIQIRRLRVMLKKSLFGFYDFQLLGDDITLNLKVESQIDHKKTPIK